METNPYVDSERGRAHKARREAEREEWTAGREAERRKWRGLIGVVCGAVGCSWSEGQWIVLSSNWPQELQDVYHRQGPAARGRGGAAGSAAARVRAGER